ncbi:MAG: hypothetical protein LBJ10_03910 [Clostridiales bacterium]|nr:hypothetical protein [Clostridiales bacterium]
MGGVNPETLDIANNLLQIAIVACAAAWSARRAALRREAAFALLAGALGCFLLGDVFYALHLWLAGDIPIVFSAADLSYLGFYAFLIAICLERLHGMGAGQRRGAKRRRIAALAAPAAVVLFHIAYIAIYPDILFNNLIFCALISTLAYFSLWLFLASGPGAESPRHPMRAFYGAVLAYLLVELAMYLVSSLGLYWPGIALDFALTLFYPLLARALKKGVGA